MNERDGLGDDLVPDYFTAVKDGGFYGWPYSYIGAHLDPRMNGKGQDLAAQAIVPDVLFQAHSASLGAVFYTGGMFPEEYHNDAFVAFHGSWNRKLRTGYKVVRVRFKDGKPVGGYEDFLTGWMLAPDNKNVWGRPVGLLVAGDGALLVSDDGGHRKRGRRCKPHPACVIHAHQRAGEHDADPGSRPGQAHHEGECAPAHLVTCASLHEQRVAHDCPAVADAADHATHRGHPDVRARCPDPEPDGHERERRPVRSRDTEALDESAAQQAPDHEACSDRSV